jgi:3,4-dihydroxy 2-butanone 4-phosphate synthase/GTP cyclohydrolase II
MAGEDQGARRGRRRMGSGLCDPFSEVLDDVRRGRMIIMVDDDDRENEGDIVVPAASVTPQQIAFMMREARGLICVSIGAEVSERLRIPLQTLRNNSPFSTPFTVSVDHRDVVGRGVLAEARAYTIRRLVADTAEADEFVSPGYIFPLVANPAGVLRRRGQTEGSYDLCRLAGGKPAGVICEILNPDGTMARGERLIDFARTHSLKITSVEEVLRYRIAQETLVRETARASLSTDYGVFQTHVFENDVDQKEHLALIYGDLSSIDRTKGPLIRLHSECLTGDVFGSRRCDCGPQLEGAVERIVGEGAGILLYLRQEGRGIGLTNKMHAYALQDQGHDTVEANLKLGFEADKRDFGVAANMLHALNVARVRLLTNNPRKQEALSLHGISVTERVPLVIPPDEYSRHYLETKKSKLGHLL